MSVMNTTWNSFPMEELIFEGHRAVVVMPHKAEGKRRFALKTEYWDAFPEAAELPLLEAGFHLCFIENDNRWGTEPDLSRKARFVRFVRERHHLSEACVPVGMSCGGLIAVKFAALFPELVSCLYLDAPVINYLSCPCGLGMGNALPGVDEELFHALGISSLSELIGCRDMPLDMLPLLAGHKIPTILVAGDSDHTVPFSENGLLLERAYKAAHAPLEVHIKPGCDHHPHGLPDAPMAIAEYILRNT